VYCAEICIGAWLETAPAAVRVLALPRFPAVGRDLSIILPRHVTFARVDSALRAVKVPDLESFALKDVFSDDSGVALASGSRALTVALTFRSDSRTLTSDEIDRAVEVLRDHAKAELGAEFRG
jgi:phenylalanyl-tRNA synthetase beta chain